MTFTKDNDIRQGDIVYSRSSKLKPSVPMVVEDRNEDYAMCVWFDAQQRLCREDIHINILTRHEQEIM